MIKSVKVSDDNIKDFIFWCWLHDYLLQGSTQVLNIRHINSICIREKAEFYIKSFCWHILYSLNYIVYCLNLEFGSRRNIYGCKTYLFDFRLPPNRLSHHPNSFNSFRHNNVINLFYRISLFMEYNGTTTTSIFLTQIFTYRKRKVTKK